MKNGDLVAFLQPAPSCFQAAEWRDATETIQDISSDGKKLVIRAEFPAGRYQGQMVTKPGAFDMQTAMMQMTRVPDGKRVPIGPMDLDHINNIMAIPMAMVTVNGRFCGGLWFSMPGPEKIAAGILSADFGFEHDGGPMELELALSPRDRERLSWNDLESLELRKDDRRTISLIPRLDRRPRFFTSGLDRKSLAEKLQAHPGFSEARAQLDPPVEEWSLYHGRNDGVFDLACVIGYAMEDAEVLGKARQALVTLCRQETWSGRPDPLLMGGENDRGLGFKLSVVGVGWEFLRDVLADDEQKTVLSKAEEYLGKMYDFTVLQRGYMGCPTPDAHSLGTWWGVGIACMAFYDELAIARKALPFFHALMIDGLAMFPTSGKSPWATFQPIWPARYFAAAIEFGGRIREVDENPFLDNLAHALLASFRSPNSQEMQRGLRTVEHRVLTAFLHAFHPSPEVPAIYAAFVEEERQLSGKVCWGMFDLLYAPSEKVEAAEFPNEPFFARDVGDVIVTAGPKRMNLQVNAGNHNGPKYSFRLQPHNRERPRSLGDFFLNVDGNPVIIKIQGSYGIFSAQRNALCFEKGCLEGDGQYLHGDIPPERSSFLRRYCMSERFVYADVNFTQVLQSKLKVRYAQRVYLVDRKTGVILVRDVWETEAPLKVGTHLHCSGRVTEDGAGRYRLTGGQANTIAGIKFGDVGLNDAEQGEIFVQVLDVSDDWNVRVYEPEWFPAYVFGLNGEAGQRFEDARYPRLQRWRLELNDRVRTGHFFFALTPDPKNLELQDGQVILPEGASYFFGKTEGQPPGLTHSFQNRGQGQGFDCTAEAVAHDRETGQVMAIGVTRWASGQREMTFQVPVDIVTDGNSGVIHSPSKKPLLSASGFSVETAREAAYQSRSLFNSELIFQPAV